MGYAAQKLTATASVMYDVGVEQGSGRPGYPWGAALLMAIPAFALAVGAGALGIGSPAGAGLAGAAGVYLAVELLVLQPKLEAKVGGASGADTAAQEFLEKALGMATIEQVAREFGATVTAAIGHTRALIIAPGAEGIRLIGASGDAPDASVLGDPTQALLWLGDADTVLGRSYLAELQQFEGAQAALKMIDAVDCDVLMPFRHRGLLLGVGLVKHQGAGGSAIDTFYSAMCAYTTVAIANTFLNAEARGHSKLSESFDLANAMQESLMPEERPVRRPTYELGGLFRPMAECGGDLWYWRELAHQRVLLVIADATGHGAAPALLAAVAKGTLDACWQMSLADLEPARLLSAMNRAVFRTGRKRYMMTAFVAVVDTRTGAMQYANAGQNFPYVVHKAHRERGQVEPLIARGNPLGATAEATYETHERVLAPEDRLIMYTDGVTDAGSPVMDPWGERRFRAALEAMADQHTARIPELIKAEVDRYVGAVELADDVTLMAFHRNEVAG